VTRGARTRTGLTSVDIVSSRATVGLDVAEGAADVAISAEPAIRIERIAAFTEALAGKGKIGR